MRKLLNTLYIFSDDVYLTLDGENVVARRGGRESGRVPLHTLESIISFAYPGASPALMAACAEKGVSLSFFRSEGTVPRLLPGRGLRKCFVEKRTVQSI